MIIWIKNKKKNQPNNKLYFKVLFKKISKYLENNFRNKSKYIYWIVWILFVFVWFNIVLNLTIFSNENVIRKIIFNKENVQKIDDEFLYQDIVKILKWKYYYTMKYRNLSKEIKSIRNEYKIVKNINISKTNNNEVYVDIVFNQPSLIFNNWKKEFWVYNWFFFDIFTWSKLLSWNLVINLPDYTQNGVFSWFFYKISENNLSYQIGLIKKTFWAKYIKQIDYLPWWWKTIVTLSDTKVLYFDHNKNILDQLNKFLLLQKNYSYFQSLKTIDLGSQDDIIVK